jgi:hypothetical protein
MVALASASGDVWAVAPPGRLGGQALHWPAVVSCYGQDRPVWLTR